MKPRKQTIFVMLLGLLLLAFMAGMAQTPAQGDQKKDSCCCCSGDSCPMKADAGAKADAAKADCCSGDSCKMKKKDMNHPDGHECCGCCGDSCEMDMKADGTMKHDMKDHKGDCCKAKSKDAKDKTKQ
jgi:hypothetical protein